MEKLTPIFSYDKLKFCSVPIPSINAHKGTSFEFTADQISKYGQSQTHPSIIYIPDGWNDHKWWLACTPYPKATDVFENPCIYYGDNDNDGNPPRIFTAINGTTSGEYTVTSNPIVKVFSSDDVNSDPDLLFDETGNNGNGILYLISRHNTYADHFGTFVSSSIDGQAWTERDTTIPLANNLTFGGGGQPSIIKDGNKFRIYYDSCSDNSSAYSQIRNRGYGSFTIYEGNSMASTFSFQKIAFLGGKAKIEPYHSDIFQYNGKYYAIFCAYDYNNYTTGDGKKVYLAKSDNGDDFYVYARPLLDEYDRNLGYYRPTACVMENGTFVMYFSTERNAPTDAESYPNGASDIPVDGRAIGVVSCAFNSLIAMLNADGIKGWIE